MRRRVVQSFLGCSLLVACAQEHVAFDAAPSDSPSASSSLCELDGEIRWCVGTSHTLCDDRSWPRTVLTFSYAWSPETGALVDDFHAWNAEYYRLHEVRFADILMQDASHAPPTQEACTAWWPVGHSYEEWYGPHALPAAYAGLDLPVVLLLDANANVLWQADGAGATSAAVRGAVDAHR